MPGRAARRGAAGAEPGQTLVEDVPNFSRVMPVAFPTTVVAVAQN